MSNQKVNRLKFSMNRTETIDEKHLFTKLEISNSHSQVIVLSRISTYSRPSIPCIPTQANSWRVSIPIILSIFNAVTILARREKLTESGCGCNTFSSHYQSQIKEGGINFILDQINKHVSRRGNVVRILGIPNHARPDSRVVPLRRHPSPPHFILTTHDDRPLVHILHLRIAFLPSRFNAG